MFSIILPSDLTKGPVPLGIKTLELAGLERFNSDVCALVMWSVAPLSSIQKFDICYLWLKDKHVIGFWPAKFALGCTLPSWMSAIIYLYCFVVKIGASSSTSASWGVRFALVTHFSFFLWYLWPGWWKPNEGENIYRLYDQCLDNSYRAASFCSAVG